MVNLKIGPEARIPQVNLLSLAALAASTPNGNFLELGVYKGGSAFPLYEVALFQHRELFLFDTFTGLPNEEPNQQMKPGGFSDTSVEEVQGWMPKAKIFKGLFPQTLTDEVKDLAFVHIDCDLRGGCQAALDLLYPRIVKGGIMAFDDWPFASISETVLKKFGKEKVKFTEVNIPYIVKE